MALRDAGPADLVAICELIDGLAAYEELAHEVAYDQAEMGRHLFGPSPSATVTLALEQDTVVGTALWFTTFSTFLGRPGIWLEDLYVVPEHRGNGHGTALIRHLRQRTTGRVEWAVLDWNAPSIAFYERLGARPLTGWTRYRWTL